MRPRTTFITHSRHFLENAALVAALLGAGSWLGARQVDGKANKAGDILIADRFNNRVIELDPGKQIV